MATAKQVKQTRTAINAIVADNKNLSANLPILGKNNFGDFANPMVEYKPLMNEFLETVVNKIGKTIVLRRIKENPLALLKKGDKPLGSDVEEIFTAMAESEEYSSIGDGLLQNKKPDVRALYHRLNKRLKYSVSWQEEEIKEAFTSFEKLTDLITGFVDSLYAGAYDTEFTLTKQLIGEGLEKDLFVSEEIVAPTDEQTAKDFLKAVKKHALAMTFNSTKYNKAQREAGVVDPVKTFTPYDQQVLIISADASVEVDVESFATAFNLSYTDFNAIDYILVVDDFTTLVGEKGEEKVVGEDIIAILADRATFQIYDDQFNMPPLFYNPDNQSQKAYLHMWQTYSISTFSNAIVFKEKATEGV